MKRSTIVILIALLLGLGLGIAALAVYLQGKIASPPPPITPVASPTSEPPGWTTPLPEGIPTDEAYGRESDISPNLAALETTGNPTSSLRYFGYYEGYDNMPVFKNHSNMVLIPAHPTNPKYLNLAHTNGLNAIVNVHSLFFESIENGCVRTFQGKEIRFTRYDLLSWPTRQSKWQSFVNTVGSLPYGEETILGFYNIDEPYLHCVSRGEIIAVASMIRGTYPDKKIMVTFSYAAVEEMYNEIQQTPGGFQIPYTHDWIAFDKYGGWTAVDFGPDQDPDTIDCGGAGIPEVFGIIQNKLLPGQQIVLVADGVAFGYDPSTASQQKWVTRANNYHALAQSSDNVAGILTFLWQDVPSGEDLRGLESMPIVSAEYKRIGMEIIGTWYDGPYDYGPYRFSVADVTGDGKADVVAIWAEGERFVVWPSNGSSFDTAVEWYKGPNNYGTYSFSVADVTGDGKADAVGIWPEEEQIIVWRSNGARFNPMVQWYKGPNDYGTYRFSVADITGDGKADVIAIHPGDERFVVWRSNGSSLNTPTQWYNGPHNYAPYEFHVADIGGDGKADIVGIYAEEERFVFWHSTGSGVDMAYEWYDGPNDYSDYRFSVIDVTGSGKANIVGLLAEGERFIVWPPKR